LYITDQSYASVLHAQAPKQQAYPGQQQPYGLSAGPGHQKPQTFEEVEAELHRTANYHSQIPPTDPSALHGNQLGGKKILTMAEVEAAMLAKGAAQNHSVPYPQQQQQQQQQQQPPQYGYGNVDPAQMLSLRQQQELLEQMTAEKELKRREQLRQQTEKVRTWVCLVNVSIIVILTVFLACSHATTN
jgi:DNA topoisomerase 2-associated protein PAT1